MTTPRQTSWLWYQEDNTEHYNIQLSLKKILYENKSKYQDIQIIETCQFGKTLILDGKTQSSLYDEFIYHESLIHPVMLLNEAPKTVFIGGGGELGTAREVLKYKSVERVVMVDLDQEVVEMCKELLPEWHGGCIEDPRLEIVYGDAFEYLKNSTDKFDVIVMDIADPIECGPAVQLYTKEFYTNLKTNLNEGGIFVTQSGACAPYNFKECFTPINRTLSDVFDNVIPYEVDVPSFACHWGFNIGFDNRPGYEKFTEWVPQSIDDRLNQRIEGELKFYDGISHKKIFSLPKYIRAGLEAEQRVITVDNPVFMY